VIKESSDGKNTTKEWPEDGSGLGNALYTLHFTIQGGPDGGFSSASCTELTRDLVTHDGRVLC
jgi:hypothetical protein